ncbi:GNAT family N-acetyltransferase [Sediminibacillus massiliensis]|uniref:GNAT family N-acetyltransferase n=1 Tax=Sediminibacillus massiliensis TaxID=1926277 RepID=UPI001FE7CFC1|nr:GNAT family N-acetyltransferase [Sediminibacillus massiliensis]
MLEQERSFFIHISPLKEEEVFHFCQWKYQEPYEMYSLDETEEIKHELLNGTYYSVKDESGNLIGYFCYGESAQVPGGIKEGLYTKNALDIGLALSPELTGKGMGLKFLKVGIRFAEEQFAPSFLRLSVAAFNQRAIKVYERAGFRKDKTFTNNLLEFIIMTRHRNRD